MEEESNCRFISQMEGAIPQLVLMGLTDNEVVVQQACKVIGAPSTLPCPVPLSILYYVVSRPPTYYPVSAPGTLVKAAKVPNP